MQISKKIYTTLIITLLTLSTIAAVIPIALAINVPGLTPATGPVGEEVEVAVTGSTAFGLVEVYWKTLATKIGEGYADGTGAVDIDVDIPNAIVGGHDLIVKDDLSSATAFAVFTVTSEIDISTESGLPGDSVIVTGTGFGDELPVGIYLGTIASVAAESVTLSGTPDSGTLAEMPVVIGTVDLDVDVTIDGLVGGDDIDPDVAVLNIAVTDDGEGNLAGESLDVAVIGIAPGLLAGEVDVAITGTINYATGVITLTASGADSAGANPVTVIVVTIDACDANYDHAQYDITPVAGEASSDVGFFEAVTIIPAIAVVDYGDYDVTAVDLDGNTDTYVTLTVDYYVTVSPTQGPAGITITITGRIPASTAYELRLGTTTIGTGTSAADTTFSNTHVVSSFLALGGHTITVVWDVTETKTTTFTVTAPPQVIYSPISGVAGATITISSITGFPFSAGANITLYIGSTAVNSTSMDDRFGPTVAFGPAAGSFTDLEFTVPTLTPESYVLTVTDEFGATTGTTYSFTVLPTPVTTVALNAAAYYLGDTLSFTFVSTDTITVNPTVTIRDPSGSTWWTATWAPTPVGTTQVVLFQTQLVNANPISLPADAPTGTWNWTITYTATAAGATTVSGLFTVSPLPTIQTVLDRLDVIETVITTTEGDIIAVINTKSGTIMTDLDALEAAIVSIAEGMVTISTSLGEVETTIASLDMGTLGVDITSIKGDVATIKTNIGTVTTSVSNLDAKVTSLSGSVATVSTSLGTLQGTVTSIEGNVATISTDVGTLEADISDISEVDMTPAWLAVVLSLVAAIAAIFAVITIRQKIAG